MCVSRSTPARKWWGGKAPGKPAPVVRQHLSSDVVGAKDFLGKMPTS
jgi:hypothetical protein